MVGGGDSTGVRLCPLSCYWCDFHADDGAQEAPIRGSILTQPTGSGGCSSRDGQHAESPTRGAPHLRRLNWSSQLCCLLVQETRDCDVLALTLMVLTLNKQEIQLDWWKHPILVNWLSLWYSGSLVKVMQVDKSVEVKNPIALLYFENLDSTRLVKLMKTMMVNWSIHRFVLYTRWHKNTKKELLESNSTFYVWMWWLHI